MKTMIIIATGSGLGGMLRYCLQIFSARLFPSAMPAGTFAVNIIGCFLIGILFALAQKNNILNEETKLFLITGFCGGFTTFSAFSIDSISLFRSGNLLYFFVYILASVALGIMATFMGTYIVKAILSNE